MVTAHDAAEIARHGHFAQPNADRQARYSAWVEPRIESGTYIGWLAVADSRVLGGAGAVLLDWGPTRANPGGQMARIANVYIYEAWRRRGIARLLLTRVIEQCESLGISEFNLAATDEARSLYSSMGFASYPAEMRRRAVTLG